MLYKSPVIEADIGEGKVRRFLLRADELKQIKRECGRGFYSLYSNYAADAEPEEVYQIIRLALIGGGTPPLEALEIASYYARPPRPLNEVYVLAYEILHACWAGVTPEDSKDDGQPVDPEEIDEFFTRIEADFARAGADATLLQDKTFAEVKDLLRHIKKGSKDAKEGPAAPSVEAFESIMRQAKEMK